MAKDGSEEHMQNLIKGDIVKHIYKKQHDEIVDVSKETNLTEGEIVGQVRANDPIWKRK